MKTKNYFIVIYIIIVYFLSSIMSICCASFVMSKDIQLAGGVYSHKKIPITKSEKIENMFIEALGGKEVYDRIASIELKNKRASLITPEMMPESIVKGTDKLGRRFIAYKQENKITGEIGVEVFYQRYSGDPYIWINGGDNALKYLFPINRGIVTKGSIEQFAKMIRDESFVPFHVADQHSCKNVYVKTKENFYVSSAAIEKIKQVIKADVLGELPANVRFLEKGDNRTFILQDIAPRIVFKYYSRDHHAGYYIKLWHENACAARNICDMYELDLLVMPKTKILKVSVEGEDYFVMAKENMFLQSLSQGYDSKSLQQVPHQLLTLIFKTGIAFTPGTLLLLSIDGAAGRETKAAITRFEEFNYGAVNYNIVAQLFDIEVFEKNRKMIESQLEQFTYFKDIKEIRGQPNQAISAPNNKKNQICLLQ